MDGPKRIAVLLVNLADALFLGALALLLWFQGEVGEIAGLSVPAVGMSDDFRTALGIGAGTLAVLSLLAAVLAASEGRARRTIGLRVGDGSDVRIPASNVEQVVAEAVTTVPAVRTASARVSQEKAGMAIDLSVVLRPEAELPGTVEQITSRVEDALAKRYGATVARKPRISVRYDSSREDAKTGAQSPVTN